jgi:CheY-like chemotaxis protein
MAILRRKRGHDDDPSAFAAELGTVRRVLENYPPGSSLTFGAPTRCPRCANFGLVLGLDGMGGGRSFNRCVSCQAEWTITARAVRAARSGQRAVVPEVSASPGYHHVNVEVDPRRLPTAPRPSLMLPASLTERPAPAGVVFSRGADGDVSRHVVRPGAPARIAAATASRPSPVREGPMRVLLIEDDPYDIEIVKAILEPVGGDTIDLRTARTRADGEKEARSAAPDLVLLDLGLPDSHGLATVTQWHFNQVAEAPVLVVSGGYGADVIDRGREFGVSGFLDKTELADLLAKGTEGTTLFLDRLAAAASG